MPSQQDVDEPVHVFFLVNIIYSKLVIWLLPDTAPEMHCISFYNVLFVLGFR